MPPKYSTDKNLAPSVLDMARMPGTKRPADWPPPKSTMAQDPKHLLTDRKPTSKRVNYDLQNSVLRSNVDLHTVVPAPKAYMAEQLERIVRIVHDPGTEEIKPGVKIGMVRQGPGPACCFADQIVAFDETTGLEQLEIIDVTCPLSLCCRGYFVQARFTDGPKEGTTEVHLSSTHDCCLPCEPCVCCCYRFCLDPYFWCMINSFAWKKTNTCCCGIPACYFPHCCVFLNTTWTLTCCPCCDPIMGAGLSYGTAKVAPTS